MLVVGCGGSHAIYGVPEVQWNRMTETERQAAREQFQQQQEIYAQTRAQAEQARDKSAEFANRCHDAKDMSEPNECQVITRRRFKKSW